MSDLAESFALLFSSEELELGTVVADAFKDFLNVLHEPVVKDRLNKFDVPEVTLTVSCLPACIARELQ